MAIFSTTIDYDDDPRWAARGWQIMRPPESFGESLVGLLRTLAAARRAPGMILSSSSGSWHPDLIAAGLLGLLPRRWRPVIVLSGCMWQRDGGLGGKIQALILRLADRAIARYAVQSSEELTLFPQLWHIDPAKIRLCPYFYTFVPADLAQPPPAPGNYVFAGGNAHRDYEPLLAAARQMPEQHFVLATRLLAGRDDIPPNVTAGPVPHREFVALMQGAAAVVTPIKPGLTRAAGQQTYLNAMWLGKPSIVTDSLGVHDHIVHGETGFIVKGSAECLVETLRYVLDPANAAAIERLCARAQQAAREQFSFEQHVGCLLAVLDEALAEAGRSAPS